jgi:hypothetical protein|tara:strand:+ start:500 stop:715 length:216 start_codon:yes stop_codon:yes gene_type:complete
MTSEELRSLFKGYLKEMGANQDPEIAARAFYEELEFYTCEECNEEKPWSNGSDSSPECDECWAKNQENTHG